MSGPVATLLADGKRLHLQHGPIDLVIGVEGERQAAFDAAWARFRMVLGELVSELPLLRRTVGEIPCGAVARRMYHAARPHGARTFVTPMIAVAGAVAEDVLSAMLATAPLRRAYVNNGGDIAFHLAPDERFRMAISGLGNRPLGGVDIDHAARSRGIATSGCGGRSLSFGIADAVTVLADTAAAADAAATLVANAVDIPGHAHIARAPANSIFPDSDLGARLAVTDVGPLTPDETRSALERGRATANSLLAGGLLNSAALFLNGQTMTVGSAHDLHFATKRIPKHA